MASFYRIGGKWMIVLLAIIMLVAVGCSSDSKDNGNNDTNHAPQISSVNVNPSSVGSSGGTASVSVSASDSDGDNLTYSYSATYGTVSGTSSIATWVLPANSGTNPVNAVVNVSVSDGTANVTSSGNCTVQAAAAATTSISGTLSLQAGASGNLDNAQVAIYPDLTAWNTYAPAKFTAAVGQGLGATATYMLDPVAQGTWYLDAWKDNDGSSNWTVGDLVGWYGTGGLNAPSLSSFSLAQNEQKVINIVNMRPVL